MGVLTLTVISDELQQRKNMQFDPSILVFDACKVIRDKMGMQNTDMKEYGLMRLEDDATKCVWMENGRTLEYYLVRDKDRVVYKKKIRFLRIRSLDGAVKMVRVDESQPLGDVMVDVCSKMGISNHEEYSLVRDSPNALNGSIANLRDYERDDKKGGLVTGTLRKKDQQKMENLRGFLKRSDSRQKLHTDEDIAWVDRNKTLREQGVEEEEVLLLRRKFFFSDTNVDSRDPVQLNLLYVQCRDGVLRGLHPVTRETACQLAALQCQIQYGDFPQKNLKFGIDAQEVLPKEYAKNKDNEKRVVQNYKELASSGLRDLDAKSKYVHLCRELKTYGVTFFVVKEKMKGKNKLVPRLLGVNKESVMRVDEKTKDVLQEWPLEQVRRWVPSPKTFTLDFGDYQEGYYSVQTNDGEKIGQLIAGYIDIILMKRRTKDHLGIEGDEGSTMLEDMVAPARATLVAHGQINGAGQQAQDGNVALRGVLRTPHAPSPYGYGINDAQYGAVSGEVSSQSMGQAQRTRIVDVYEQPQRALIGTIEATIKAVDEAEEELLREPEIEIPKFPDDAHARKWVDDQVAVQKENVNERLAAMGAATAQVVQWTAVQEEYNDGQLGTALTTIRTNLPDVGRNVRDLAYFMEEDRKDDLVQATRRLCGAFGDFLHTVNPEHEERRTTVLAAAGRVGEFSQEVITNMDEQTTQETGFRQTLLDKARQVANSAASLVRGAKTISTDYCEDQELKDNVIRSATQCAFATSQLVTCTRVVAPTIESQACQEQLTSAANQVSHAVEELIVDAETAVNRVQGGDRALGDLHTAARQVTSALDELLAHVRTSPGMSKRTEEETYNEVIRRTNRIVAHQGPSEDMTREAKKVIRQSQILMEQFEHEAHEQPEHRDRLLDAARRVATATSNMIDATRECESRPTEAESEIALRSAAERMNTVTNETTSETQAKHIMERLEQAARQTAYEATQTIAAANAAKETITQKVTVESLILESSDTAGHVPKLITSIRESQQAKTKGEQFRAQSRLIRDSFAVLPPATRLVETSRTSVAHVSEPHVASSLQQASNQLATSLAELRTALNDAQKLNFSQQLFYSEELIKELDQQLLDTQTAAVAQRLTASPGCTGQIATSHLMQSARQVGSSVAQLVTSSQSHDEQHIGSSAVEAAHSLRSFADSVTEVVSTRKDVQLDEFIVQTRSVVHDTGRVFDRVRTDASPLLLADAAKQVSTSLRKVIACLPDHQQTERAIHQIRTIAIGANLQAKDVQTTSSRLLDATSQVQTSVSKGGHHEAVEVFVNAYTEFHTSVIAAVKNQQMTMTERSELVNQLEQCRDEAVSVLSKASVASGDLSQTPALSTSTKTFSESVTRISTRLGIQEQPWVGECDAALRQIQSVRHVSESADVPYSRNGFFDSLDAVTEHSRRLGDSMTGIARHAKAVDTQSLCNSVRSSADAVCSLAESASHSAYLVGVSHPRSQRGRTALIDASRVQKSCLHVQQICSRIERNEFNQEQLLAETATLAKQTSLLANILRDASEGSQNVNVKKQCINFASEVAKQTRELIEAVRILDRERTPVRLDVCVRQAAEMRSTAEQLEHYVERPDFAPVAAKLSVEGVEAQRPVLFATKNMLDASSNMIRTTKDLASSPKDAGRWQRLADNSRDVSESIKRLVGAIRDAAPGQAEMDRCIQNLEQLMRDVERTALDSVGSPAQSDAGAERRVHQQILHHAQSLAEQVDPLRAASVGHGEDLAHSVEAHWSLIRPLASASCDAAAVARDSRQQAELFDKCRTVVEAELQMLYACRDAGGNPRATEHHSRVDEGAAQLKDALVDIRNTIVKIGADKGQVQGMVDRISHSIAGTDSAPSPSHRSFTDHQTNMNHLLEDIKKTAVDMPFADKDQLGNLSLHLSDRYTALAGESNHAVAILPNPDVAQKLKVAVQKLGTACIETVKISGQRRAHFAEQRIQKQLGDHARLVQERVDEVYNSLREGAKGTQACINAAVTVSGIITDLDTSIMFATSGSLNPTGDVRNFDGHREAILKTAKALVEDTKGLVAGAASNQEQLAVAAHNAVRTIVTLTDAVKTGAQAISPVYPEAQVLVIHSVRDVAAALSSLIQATKNASGKSLHDPAMTNLKEAAKMMVTNISSLLKTVRSVEDRQQQGTRALEAAMEAISHEIKVYDHEATETGAGPSTVTPEQLARATSKVTEAAHRLASAAESSSQPDAMAAANFARQSVTELLAVARAAASDAETPEGRYRTLDAGRDVATQINALLVALHHVLVRSSDQASRQMLVDASRHVARAVRDLIGCSDILKGDAWGAEAIAEPSITAENELFGAASSIEAAAVKLAELRPRVQPSNDAVDENLAFDEQILSSAKSITTAVQTLVKAASAAQRELLAQGRLSVTGGENSEDYQWSEGLVSAARLVVHAVHQLCEAANMLVQGQAGEERLVSAAKQVASSTAQLLVACNVKADMDSQARKRLQAAGHAVKTATERLVQAARQTVVEDERHLVIADRMVHGIAQVMSAKEEVLRKENELKNARATLAALHRARYERDGSPQEEE